MKLLLPGMMLALSLTSLRVVAFAPFASKIILPMRVNIDPRPSASCNIFKHPTFLRMSSSSTLPEASAMRVSELKKELESYGISTKSFFEKNELVEAVEKARSEGKTPKSSSSTSSKTNSRSDDNDDKGSREERLQQEMEKCNAMKASELKAELKSYGISTSSFFEKSEFVKACAEARVDGASNKKSSGSSSSRSSGENYAEYSNVEVITDDSAGPRKRSQDQNQSQSGGNPFGGGAGIADMMKNMGMGGNPFSGMGGNPFGGMGGGGGGGDAMKKAQEMMSNPKVREIIMKAQSNPKIMKAVQECMGNPMAFAKYQNDPEVGELIRELQKYM